MHCSVIWNERSAARGTIGSRDVFPVFLADNYRTARLSTFPACAHRPPGRPAIAAARRRPWRRRYRRSVEGPTAGGRRVLHRLPVVDVIDNLRRAGVTGARWPAAIRRRLNFRPLHIVMISELIDDARVRGAPLEINLQPPPSLPRLAARLVSRQMQSRFSEDLTIAGVSGYRPGARPAQQYFLINTSDAIDATRAEYIISSPTR